jgi:hypothetical protein
MTIEDAIKTIDDYNALASRALSIINGAPFWIYCGEPKFVKLSISNGLATLKWPDTGDGIIEVSGCDFPIDLLFISDEELTAWKAEERRKHDELEDRKNEFRKFYKESEERAAYLALKAKYGDS